LFLFTEEKIAGSIPDTVACRLLAPVLPTSFVAAAGKKIQVSGEVEPMFSDGRG